MKLAQKVAQYRYHSSEAARLAAEIAQTLHGLTPGRPGKPQPEVAAVARVVATFYRLPVEQLMSHIRRADVAKARMVAMVLLRRCTRLPLVAIGDGFSRDHTTVVHATRALQARCDTEPNFAAELAQLEQLARQALQRPIAA